jgi:hypothetical protein
MRDFRFFSAITECYLHRFLLMVQNFGAIPARARRFFAFTPGAGPGFFGGNNENARRPIMAPGAIPLLHFCKYPIAAAASRAKFLLAPVFAGGANSGAISYGEKKVEDAHRPRPPASLASNRFLRFDRMSEAGAEFLFAQIFADCANRCANSRPAGRFFAFTPGAGPSFPAEITKTPGGRSWLRAQFRCYIFVSTRSPRPGQGQNSYWHQILPVVRISLRTFGDRW